MRGIPWWLVIIVIGIAGCGYLFLKAREMESAYALKRVKEGDKKVKEAAKHASGAIGVPMPPSPVVEKAKEPVEMSRDKSNQVANILSNEQLEDMMQ